VRKIVHLSLIAIIFALTGLLLTRSASLPPFDLGPQQSVTTVNPEMGVHTRLTDEVEAWKIKYTLQMVREMGAPWVVEYFPWAYREKAFWRLRCCLCRALSRAGGLYHRME